MEFMPAGNHDNGDKVNDTKDSMAIIMVIHTDWKF